MSLGLVVSGTPELLGSIIARWCIVGPTPITSRSHATEHHGFWSQEDVEGVLGDFALPSLGSLGSHSLSPHTSTLPFNSLFPSVLQEEPGDCHEDLLRHRGYISPVYSKLPWEITFCLGD